MDMSTGELMGGEEAKRRKKLRGPGLLKMLSGAEADQAEAMLGGAKDGVFVSKHDNRSPLGKKFTASRKRQRYLDKKRRVREGNRRVARAAKGGAAE